MPWGQCPARGHRVHGRLLGRGLAPQSSIYRRVHLHQQNDRPGAVTLREWLRAPRRAAGLTASFPWKQVTGWAFRDPWTPGRLKVPQALGL